MENKSDVKVRVVNKNSEGVTIHSMDGKIEQFMKWEDFNRYFRPTEDKFIYQMHVSSEEEAEIKKVTDRLHWIMSPEKFARLLMIVAKSNRGENPELDEMTWLGAVVSEYQELFGQNQMQFIVDFNQAKEIMFGSFSK